jgi:hypothetical protein
MKTSDPSDFTDLLFFVDRCPPLLKIKDLTSKHCFLNSLRFKTSENGIETNKKTVSFGFFRFLAEIASLHGLFLLVPKYKKNISNRSSYDQIRLLPPQIFSSLSFLAFPFLPILSCLSFLA